MDGCLTFSSEKGIALDIIRTKRQPEIKCVRETGGIEKQTTRKNARKSA